MTNKNVSNVRALRKYRKYNAYKCVFEVVQGNENKMSARDRFSKTILFVMNWLVERNAKADEEEGMVCVPVFLWNYPAPEEYKTFDPSQIIDIDPGSSGGIGIAYYQDELPDGKEECFVLQVEEPGDANETVITEVSVHLLNETVLLAVRGAIRMPLDTKRKIPYYRPAFVRTIIRDYKNLRLVEYGVDERYAFHLNHSLRINGKNTDERNFFLTNMLDNEKRQLPVFLISEDGFNKFGGELAYMPKTEEEFSEGEKSTSEDITEEEKEEVKAEEEKTTEEKATEEKNGKKPIELKGFKKPSKNKKKIGKSNFDIVHEELRKSMSMQAKLEVIKVDSANERFLEKMENVKAIKVKERMIINAAAGAAIGYAHFCVIEGSVRKLCLGTEYEKYIPRLEAGELILLGNDETKDDYKEYFALNEKKQMSGSFMDEMRQMMENSGYEFRDIEFYNDIRIRKSEKDIRIMLSDGEKDPEVLVRNINELRQTISDLQEEIKQAEEDHRLELENASAEILKYKNEAAKWKHEFEKLNSHQGTLVERHDAMKKEKEAIEKDLEKAGDGKVGATVVKDLSGHGFIRGMDGILNLPADVKLRKDDFEAWIRQYYSETLILHENAIKSFRKSELNNDRMRTLAAMIHFLHGCTIYWNAGMWDLTNDNTVDENYNLYRLAFELSKSSDITLEKYRSKYTIDISEYDSEKSDVLIGDHVKYHNGHDLDLVRLYYYYDKKIKKTIIGFMPDHLDTVSEGPK